LLKRYKEANWESPPTTNTLRNIHTFALLLKSLAMDAFITIFTSSVSEETPSQVDFEGGHGGGGNYCVIV
jgi:hypothetical protein